MATQSNHGAALGILKWVALTTFLCVVVLFFWFALRQAKELASLSKSHHRSADRGLNLSPTPSPQAVGDALESKQFSAPTPFGMWQAANGSPTPLVQLAQNLPVNTPTEPTPTEPLAKASSSPQRDLIPRERTGNPASDSRQRHLPLVTHRISHDRRQQYPGTQVREARQIADLENQLDLLRSQLKDTEAKVLAIQNDADLFKRQRDELQTRLSESEEKTQIAQDTAELLAKQLDELRDQLKETQNRALTAQKNEKLLRNERDTLETQLQESQDEVQAARKNANSATRQRDMLQSEIGEIKERAQLAETKANQAASQRDAMEAELKKKEQEEVQEKKAQLNQNGSNLAELPSSAPDTQFEVVRQNARPVHENAELAQTLPPNPGQNARPAPLTQTLDSSVQPTDFSRE